MQERFIIINDDVMSDRPALSSAFDGSATSVTAVAQGDLSD
jgi:hypothetical protein